MRIQPSSIYSMHIPLFFPFGMPGAVRRNLNTVFSCKGWIHSSCCLYSDFPFSAVRRLWGGLPSKRQSSSRAKVRYQSADKPRRPKINIPVALEKVVRDYTQTSFYRIIHPPTQFFAAKRTGPVGVPTKQRRGDQYVRQGPQHKRRQNTMLPDRA